VCDTPSPLALVGKTPKIAPMVDETPNPVSNLLPDRYPQHDLFICDVADAVLIRHIRVALAVYRHIERKPTLL